MSIVAVHGPNTFGSKAVTQNSSGSAYATVNPANGLIWTLQARDTSQVAANYDWAYTGSGTPASPIADTKSPVITFGAGAHTVTLTLNGVAQPTFVVNAVAGTGAQAGLLGVDEGGDEPPPEIESASRSAPEDESEDVAVGYDPAAHTIEEVKEFVTEHPDEAQAIYDTEVAGKSRATLLSWLDEQIPFDPEAHTVAEVQEFVTENPDQAQDTYDAEVAGKNRVTLVEWLENILTE